MTTGHGGNQEQSITERGEQSGHFKRGFQTGMGLGAFGKHSQPSPGAPCGWSSDHTREILSGLSVREAREKDIVRPPGWVNSDILERALTCEMVTKVIGEAGKAVFGDT